MKGDERIRTAARWLRAVLAYVRRSEPTAQPSRTPLVFDMETRRGWGNRISWSSWAERRIDGHVTPKPRVGDEVRCRMRSGEIARFRVVDVEHVMGVPDMFFATVEDIGYVDVDSPSLTCFSVFGGVIEEARDA